MISFPPPLNNPTIHLRIEGDTLFSYVAVSCVGSYAKNFIAENPDLDALQLAGEMVRASASQRVVWYDEVTDIFELNKEED